MSIENFLSVLNEEQLAAVTHEGSPLLILAGAGSGKTRVITTKIAYLIAEKGVLPSSILAVTFTKKASAEMLERAKNMEPSACHSMIRTFHSFGSWFLRLFYQEAQIDKNFTVYDDDDSIDLLLKAMPHLTKQKAKMFMKEISRAKDYCYMPESPELSTFFDNQEINEAYEVYEKKLRSTGNVDFGDLIMLPYLVLKESQKVRDYVHSRFKVIMVDEYQDSNIAQFLLLEQLAGPETYLCVVGDDDQSIYKFRGAEVDNILDFDKCFPGTQIIKLEKNYRSTPQILGLADRVVKNNKNRLGKTLVAQRPDGKNPKLIFLLSQDDEAAFCAEIIQKSHSHNIPYTDWAITYRTNAQSLSFENEFMKRNIPYSVIGALKFYQREEIKDIVSLLSFVANPKDEIAFRRIVNKPARGIGTKAQNNIIEIAVSHFNETMDDNYNLLDASIEYSKSASSKTKQGINDFISIVTGLKTSLLKESSARTVVEDLVSMAVSDDGNVSAVSEEETLSSFVEKASLISGLAEYYKIKDETEDTQKVANLQELANSGLMYPKTIDGLMEFLDHVQLDKTLEENEEENPESVSLITLHNTKGLEFNRVIITGLENGLFPRSDKMADEIEEERRLFYVGITRAKNELYITSCANRRMYGKTMVTEISPFLLELKSPLIDVLGKAPAAFKKFNQDKALKPKSSIEQKYARGVKIYHDDYGYGTVADGISSENGEYLIKVMFENGKIKDFIPRYQEHSLTVIKDY